MGQRAGTGLSGEDHMQSRMHTGSCKTPGCTERYPQGAQHLIPSAPGCGSGPPECEVLLGGGCSRKLRQAGPDHWDRSQPLSGPWAPPVIQEAAVQATSPRAPRPWTSDRYAQRLPPAPAHLTRVGSRGSRSAPQLPKPLQQPAGQARGRPQSGAQAPPPKLPPFRGGPPSPAQTSAGESAPVQTSRHIKYWQPTY